MLNRLRFPQTGALGRRLLLWILLISGVNALLATSLQIYLDYRQDMADLSGTLFYVRESQLPGIAEAAWNFDRSQLAVQVKGIADSPWVAGVQVRYGPNEKSSVSAGQLDERDPGVREFPLIHAGGAFAVPVGRLLVLPNMAEVYKRTSDRIVVVAITQLVKVLIVSFCLLWLISEMVTRHLKRMADYAHAFTPEGEFQPLQLDRGGDFSDDELSELQDSLNKAYRRLNEAHAAELSQRERLEAEVAERTRDLGWANRRLALSLRAGRLATWDWSVDSNENHMDDAWLGMLGYLRGEIPETYASFRSLMHPDDVPRMEAEVEAHLSGRTDFYQVEFRLRAKDGSWRWISSAGLGVDRDSTGRITRMVGVQHDVTDRREAEEAVRQSAERLRIILDTVADGIVIADADGLIEMINPAACVMLGETEEKLLGSRLTDLLPGLSDGQGDDPKATLAALTGSRREMDLPGRHENPLPVDAGFSHAHIGGSVYYIVGLHDVSAHREAAKAKQAFVSSVSHEIRTPMNAIIGMSMLALRTELTPRQRDYLNKIALSSESLLRVINDILDFSKIEAGKLELEHCSFVLDDVLSKVADIITVATEAKGLEVMFSVAPEVPPLLIGDSLRLEQILINLASNAAKFTERGEIVIEVKCAEEKGAFGSGEVDLHFLVRDTGIGITSEQLARLFRPFSQADSSMTRRYGGSGLGLAICHKLVSLMHGRIWADSLPGVGSEFQFVARVGVDTQTRVDAPALPERRETLRLLIVDDNATSRLLLVEMLRHHGFVPETANSGSEALRLLAEAADRGLFYDLVLLDWRMPGLDGMETARLICNSHYDARTPAILMVTAFGREEIAQQAHDIGLDGFVTKPVTETTLIHAIADILSRRFGGADLAGLGERRCGSVMLHSQIQKPPAALLGRRVLLVEDNAFNRQVAQELLEDAQVYVDIAVNGRDAIGKVRPGRYDAILMDIQMPEMDGLTATRHLRADADLAVLPIIAMTAHGMAEDRQRSLAAGMNDHITKPIDAALFYTTLVRWLPPAGDFLEEGRADASEGISPPADNYLLPDELPGIDIEAGLRVTGGRPRRFARLLRHFLADMGQAAVQLQDYLAAGQRVQAQELAHALKGAAGNAGALVLQEAAALLEKYLHRESTVGMEDSRVLAAVDSVAAELGCVARACELLPVDVETGEAEVHASPAPLATDELSGILDGLAGRLARQQFISPQELSSLAERLINEGARLELAALGEALDHFDFAAASRALKGLRQQVEASHV